MTRTGPPERDELIGQPCGGSYVISRLLGEGGMGAVYVATSDALAGKLAAVKVLQPDVKRRPGSLERFRAEVYAAGKIDDPNIVKVFDTGELQDGRVYMLMEYCPAGSLEALLKQRGVLPLELVLTVLAPVGSALDAAHTDARITHRDIKPANILLATDSGLLRGKLADFGVAKLHDMQLRFVETTTQKIMGSPGYMAPEQCGGKGEVDGRTDIYAFGSVLYEVVTGQRPYPIKSIFDLIHNVATNAPFPSPRKLRRDLPPEWEAVILGCLEHRRTDRIPSIKEVVQRLARSIPNGESLMSFVAPRLVDSRSAPTAVTISEVVGPAATLWSGARAVHGCPRRRPRPLARSAVVLLSGVAVGGGATRLALDGSARSVPAPESPHVRLAEALSSAGSGEQEQPPAVCPVPPYVSTVPPYVSTVFPVLPLSIDQGASDPGVSPASLPVGHAGGGAMTALAAPGDLDKPQRQVEKRAVPASPPVEYGTLRVEVEPWADVSISGEREAYTTPVTIPLSAGRHRVALSRGTQKEAVDVTITPNEITQISRSW